MDADDFSRADRFEKQVDYLEKHPDCVLLGSQILMVDPYGSKLYEPQHQLTHEGIEAELLAGSGWAIVHPAAMMVRDAVVESGGYRKDLEVSEDLDLFLRLAVKGRIANLPDVLLHYRQHPQSVNHTKHVEQNRAMKAIITQAYSSRGKAMPENWKLPQRDVIPLDKEINMWAWLALKNGNVLAARKHAVTLLKMAPFSMNSWRLMYCCCEANEDKYGVGDGFISAIKYGVGDGFFLNFSGLNGNGVGDGFHLFAFVDGKWVR